MALLYDTYSLESRYTLFAFNQVTSHYYEHRLMNALNFEVLQNRLSYLFYIIRYTHIDYGVDYLIFLLSNYTELLETKQSNNRHFVIFMCNLRLMVSIQTYCIRHKDRILVVQEKKNLKIYGLIICDKRAINFVP